MSRVLGSQKEINRAEKSGFHSVGDCQLKKVNQPWVCLLGHTLKRSWSFVFRNEEFLLLQHAFIFGHLQENPPCLSAPNAVSVLCVLCSSEDCFQKDGKFGQLKVLPFVSLWSTALFFAFGERE